MRAPWAFASNLRLLSSAAVGLALVGCSSILSIDNYRACTDAECGDAGDAAPEAPAASCATAQDCAAPAIACSNQRCATVSTLVEGTVSQQCVILSDQSMWCWGANDHGQLGRGVVGGQFEQPQPVTVIPGNNGITQAAMGNDYGCAQTAVGEVWCWGDGVAGSGSGTAIKVSLPAKAVGLSGGSTGACALTTGGVYCWGANDYGDIGCDGDAGTPQIVFPGSPRMLLAASDNIAQVAVGLYGTCARENGNDTVHCFGNAAWGILGDGTPQQADKSCQTSKFSGFATNKLQSITGSDFSACAKDINGMFFCWGVNWVFFQAGLIWPANTAQVFTTPFTMPLPTSTLQVSIGWQHSCSIDRSGTVQCWGLSTHGETGAVLSGAQKPRAINIPLASAIAAHRQFTCALLEDGRVSCWGNNQFLTVGPATLGQDVPTPTIVAFP